MDEKLKELYGMTYALRLRASGLLRGGSDGRERNALLAIVANLEDSTDRLEDILPQLAIATVTTDQLDALIALRPNGDPADVAAEVVGFIVALDVTSPGALSAIWRALEDERKARATAELEEHLAKLANEMTHAYLRPELRKMGIESPEGYRLVWEAVPVSEIDPFEDEQEEDWEDE
jgi:hypothetical protein